MPIKNSIASDPDKLNWKMANFVSKMSQLEELSLSFIHLDESWLNMFADVITKLAKTLRHLEIVSHGAIDKHIDGY